MTSAKGRALRIGLLPIYFWLFDAAMPPEFMRDRTASVERVWTDRRSRRWSILRAQWAGRRGPTP